MLHLPPKEILKLKRELIVARPQLFIPGMTPVPQILGAAREVSPGSQSWNAPGTYSWAIPNFNTLNIAVLGAGGGGSGAGWVQSPCYYIPGSVTGPGPKTGPSYAYPDAPQYTGGAGNTGGYGQFYIPSIINMVAYGGAGGPGGSTWQSSGLMGIGANGQGYNGNVANYNGQGGAVGTYGYTYCAVQTYQANGHLFQWVDTSHYAYGGYGGYGGRCDSRFTMGQLVPGTVVTIVIQGGGSPGYQATNYGGAYPTYGGNALVSISWN